MKASDSRVDAVLVSVLTPVLNEIAHLPQVVARMREQDLDGAAEFIFIDGGSTDGSREWLAEQAEADPRVRLLDNPRGRAVYALNIGLAAARGEYVARMDAHSLYPAGYLRVGVNRLRAGGVTHVSGPQVAVGDGRGWTSRVALALSVALGVGGARFRRRGGGGEFAVDTGFTGVWRRDVLVRAGGWDELWTTDEDCELAFRLRELEPGEHVCLPAMAAEYIPRGSLSRLARQYWEYGRHKVRTFRRHPAAMRPSHLLPPAVAATVVVAPVSRAARAGIGVYCAALAFAAVRVAAAGARPMQALALPLVLATMHLAYGFGVLVGACRDGAPTEAIRRIVRRPV